MYNTWGTLSTMSILNGKEYYQTMMFKLMSGYSFVEQMWIHAVNGQIHLRDRWIINEDIILYHPKQNGLENIKTER